MVVYRCFGCQKEVPQEFVRRRIRCPFCDSKIIYKPRTTTTVVEAV